MKVRTESVLLVAIVVVLIGAVILQGGSSAADPATEVPDTPNDPAGDGSPDVGDDGVVGDVGDPATGDTGNDAGDSGSAGDGVTDPTTGAGDGVSDPTTGAGDGVTDPTTGDGGDVADPTTDAGDNVTDPATDNDSNVTDPTTDDPTAPEGTAIFVVDGFTVGSAELEVADTPAELEAGLGGRTELAPGTGMVFVFDQEYFVSMWMKDTNIPLDLIFVKSDGTVTNVAEASPEPGVADADLTRYESGDAVQYVIALNQGWAASHDVVAGSTVELDLGDDQ
ncbi:DUF192 domain-containing protein [Haloarchaeobius sp. DFWS5]|uniref:DUF192 domain-containing protein n=1 Tax=Haloarchaeobius sp. DFWS5 TaxID=3446114 RepID=UPI003EBD668E